MAVTASKQALYWGIAAAVLAALLLWLGDVLLPFVLGGAVAYFLDPVADRLERWGLSRTLAVAVITILAILVFAALILLVVPTLVEQTTGLVRFLSSIDEDTFVLLFERFPVLARFEDQITAALTTAADTLRERGGAIFGGLVTASQGLLGVALLLVIVPVVAFYMLLDWDRMVARVDELLPREHAPTIRRLAGQVDDTLSGFIRGQGTVMLVLGTYYAGALALTGLNFGLVVGALAGLISFIPYVGAIVGGGLAIGLALFQFWGDWTMIGIVAAIFASGQMIEGNVLTPKLVGDSVGLHPVWLLFALSAFGAAFGFVGLLVAVPVAACIGVVVRFGVERYRASPLYHGSEAGELPPPGAAPPPPDAPPPGRPPAA